jgi:1-acyl-sn-glycerol-3-phosphate acyltransferase
VVLHVLGKGLAYVLFSLVASIMALTVFPLLRLFVHPDWRFRRAMRAINRWAFVVLAGGLWLLGIIRVRVINAERLKNARGLVVVANHPTYLDVIILLALVRQANCIVKGSLWSNPALRGMVSQVFIPQFADFESMCAKAKASLDEGDNLIIFPEGTRSVRGQPVVFKRGAVQLALRGGHDILPIRIGVPDSTGMAKHDPVFAVPSTGSFRFTLEILEPVSVAPYRDWEPALAARTLTKQVQELILSNSSPEVHHG